MTAAAPAVAWRRMLAVAAGILALDQLAKAVVNAALERGEEVSLALGFELVHVRNDGIAFGLFDEATALVLAVTIVALLAFLAWFAAGPSRPWLWLGVGLVIGGALGNLVDRLRGEGVTDFFDPPAWPAFNLADVAITAGIAVLILAAFVSERGDAAEAGVRERGR